MCFKFGYATPGKKKLVYNEFTSQQELDQVPLQGVAYQTIYIYMKPERGRATGNCYKSQPKGWGRVIRVAAPVLKQS
jgi:hypothetical protein